MTVTIIQFLNGVLSFEIDSDMNDEEFKRKLSEVAEWHIPEIKLTGTERRKIRGRLSNEDKYQDEHEQIFFEIFGGVNPTTTPEVTKVHRAACTCPDCGVYCAQGRSKEAKIYTQGATPVWREKCLNCKMFKNPKTGQFDLTGVAASHQWQFWAQRELNKLQKQQQATISDQEDSEK